jgi:hypothetical protein
LTKELIGTSIWFWFLSLWVSAITYQPKLDNFVQICYSIYFRSHFRSAGICRLRYFSSNQLTCDYDARHLIIWLGGLTMKLIKKVLQLNAIILLTIALLCCVKDTVIKKGFFDSLAI